jgi:hypothetical protein
MTVRVIGRIEFVGKLACGHRFVDRSAVYIPTKRVSPFHRDGLGNRSKFDGSGAHIAARKLVAVVNKFFDWMYK